MDEVVRRALEKWPNVPAVFGWLRLDERGRWYLRGEPIRRRELLDFIGRNYESDERGRWYFQNGPQRGYVELDCAPWVLYSQPNGSLLTHTGAAVEGLDRAFVDDRGRLFLRFERGLGLLSGGDTAWALGRFRDGAGEPLAEDAVIERLEHPGAGGLRLTLEYDGRLLPVEPVTDAELPARGGFVRDPRPD